MKTNHVDLTPEVRRIQAHLGSFAGATSRADRKTAKAFMLADWWFYNGVMWSPKSKHVGCGIYELSAERKFQ